MYGKKRRPCEIRSVCHLYEASGLVKISINASYKTAKVYKTMLSNQNASIIGTVLVPLSNAATCFLMGESSLKLFNASIEHLKAFTGFFVAVRS